MKLKLIVLSFAAMISSPISVAESPSFNYLELTYSKFEHEVNSFLSDGQGPGLRGAAELTDSLFITAEFKPLDGETSINLFNIKHDADLTTVGFGYKMNYGESSLWYAKLERKSLDTRFDLDADSIRLGTRSLITENIELGGSIANHSLDYHTGRNTTEIGYQFEMNVLVRDNFSIVTDAEKIDDLDFFNIGIRVNF